MSLLEKTSYRELATQNKSYALWSPDTPIYMRNVHDTSQLVYLY